MRRLALSALVASALSAIGCAAEPPPAPPSGPPAEVALSPEAGFVDVPARDVSLKGQPIHVEATARLFYNLRPADESPGDKPIFVVFNGFAAEVVRAFGTGPTTVADGGEVVKNPASLTKIANLLYIEPRQAGYSYDVLDRPVKAGDCAPAIFNEYVDAADVLLGVIAFLGAHPDLRGPIHWVGESYAGVRVQWILAYLRDRWDLASYQDPALKAAIAAVHRPGSLRAGQILLQPWLVGKAHTQAINAVCYDAAEIASVSASLGAACAEMNACACVEDHDRSLYNYTFTDEHQTQREYEASEAHVIPSRAAALLGLPLESIAGLGAADRKKGFKCSPADDSVPPEGEMEKLLGALPAGQSYYAPYSPLLPGKETAKPILDWHDAGVEGPAFLDNLRDVPAFVTDGARDLVVPTRALAPALTAIAGAGRIDASKAGQIRVKYPDGERIVEIHTYPSAGHMITMLEPEAFARDVTAWLATLPASP
jgi:pimeloyl-ACP methyl ester carboxylesterase